MGLYIYWQAVDELFELRFQDGTRIASAMRSGFSLENRKEAVVWFYWFYEGRYSP